jgi:hypothetical protein
VEAFLGVIGSIASIAAIPLAVYFYLRSREAANQRVRREIARILSYQLGEDRVLTAFEVKSVIDSKLHDGRMPQDLVSTTEIINDLVADTIANPMLDSQRKSRILENLRQVADSGEVFRIISRYRIEPPDVVRLLEVLDFQLHPEDATLARQSEVSAEVLSRAEMSEIEPLRRLAVSKEAHAAQSKRTAIMEASSTVFALIATMATGLAVVLTQTGFDKTIKSWFNQNQYLLNLLLGVVGSVVAAIVTYYFAKGRSSSFTESKPPSEEPKHTRGARAR